MTHRLSVLVALEKRVLNMEARYFLENGSMLEDGDPWDVVQPHRAPLSWVLNWKPHQVFVYRSPAPHLS